MIPHDVELVWPGKEQILARGLSGTRARAFVPAEVYLGTGGPAAEEPQRGRFYVGDNLEVMGAIREEFGGTFDLIYLDPPFCTGNVYGVRTVETVSAGQGDARQEVRRTTAYSDRWEGGTAGYLSWLYPRIRLMYELLAPAGSFVCHLDWRAASHVRLLLDEVFGPDRLMNELIWYKGFRGTQARAIFQRAHDVLWWYTKGDGYWWEQDFEPYKDRDLKRYNRVDEDGRQYARIKRRRTDGTVYYGKTYPGTQGKRRNDVIADIPTMAATARERTGFATQKPVRLLELLVRSLCPPGGLVADFFAGTGTTLRAAARLGRRFVGADRGPAAVHLTRRGLLADGAPPSFAVFRPDDAVPAPRPAGAAWIERDAAGRLHLLPDARNDPAIEVWAVDPAPAGTPFRPAWFACGRGPRTLPAASPPFPATAPLTVLLSGRDGTERWLRL
jgi:DNA modification methylase